MVNHPKTLVIGSAGQIGTELVPALRRLHGDENVVAGWRKTPPDPAVAGSGPTEAVDATDRAQLDEVIARHGITIICNLASLLSGEGEEKPHRAWNVNLGSHKLVLDAAVDHGLSQVFWPSSIAVFGAHAPPDGTPQHTVLEPETMYGVTKVAGENLSNYYFTRFGLDVRSVRYPGLITVKKFSGGGTSDYSVEMLLSALARGPYRCFVRADTVMPLMAMEDAVDATIQLMQAPANRISIRTSYNLGALSFTAKELEQEIRKRIPDFSVSYEPDFRQAIADSWPNTVDDSAARRDWGWQERIGLAQLVANILETA